MRTKRFMAGVMACAVMAGAMPCTFASAYTAEPTTEQIVETILDAANSIIADGDDIKDVTEEYFHPEEGSWTPTRYDVWDYLEVEVGCGEAWIMGIKDNAPEELIIPDYIGSTPITTVFGRITGEGLNIRKLRLPNTLKDIRSGFMSECPTLEEITGGESLETVDEGVFAGTAWLKNVRESGEDTLIGTVAFNLVPDDYYYDVPDEITCLASGAVVSDELDQLWISSSLMRFAYDAFDNCPNVAWIGVPSDNMYYTSVDGVLYSRSLDCLEKYPPAKRDYNADYETSFKVNEITWVMSAGAFSGAKYLTEVNLAGISSIPAAAFKNSSVKNIKTDGVITSISDSAFEGCTGLEAIDFVLDGTGLRNEDGVVVSEYSVELYPSAKTDEEYTVFDGAVTISAGAFRNAVNLKKVTLPDTLEDIFNDAFNGCSGIEELELPRSVFMVWEGAFKGMTSLKKLTINDPYCIFSFEDVLDLNDCRPVICGAVGSTAQAFAIQNGLEFVSNGEDVTEDEQMLCKYVIDPEEGVAHITGRIKWEHQSELYIPTYVNGFPVKYIDDGAFEGCDLIDGIIFDNEELVIGENAFKDCVNLSFITAEGENPKGNAVTVGKGAFDGCTKLTAENSDIPLTSKPADSGAAVGKKSSDGVKGDANCDGTVTMADAALILQHLGNGDKYPLVAQAYSNADIDGNGLSAQDALTIQMYEAGIIESL